MPTLMADRHETQKFKGIAVNAIILYIYMQLVLPPGHLPAYIVQDSEEVWQKMINDIA